MYFYVEFIVNCVFTCSIFFSQSLHIVRAPEELGFLMGSALNSPALQRAFGLAQGLVRQKAWDGLVNRWYSVVVICLNVWF